MNDQIFSPAHIEPESSSHVGLTSSLFIPSLKVFALLSSLVTGCVSDDDSDDVDTGAGQSAEVSLSADVMPLINKSCGGCHTRTNAPFPVAVDNGVFYDEKDDLLALVGTFIVPDDPMGSGFLAILTQDLAVGQGPTLMPPPGMAQPMAADDVAVVVAWITGGAKDN